MATVFQSMRLDRGGWRFVDRGKGVAQRLQCSTCSPAPTVEVFMYAGRATR